MTVNNQLLGCSELPPGSVHQFVKDMPQESLQKEVKGVKSKDLIKVFHQVDCRVYEVFAERMKELPFESQVKLCKVLVNEEQHLEVVEKVALSKLFESKLFENSKARSLAISMIQKGFGYDVMKKAVVTGLFHEDRFGRLDAGYLAEALLKKGEGSREAILAATVILLCDPIAQPFAKTTKLWKMLFSQGQGHEEAKALVKIWRIWLTDKSRPKVESVRELQKVLTANGQEVEKVTAVALEIMNIDEISFNYNLRARTLRLWKALVKEGYVDAEAQNAMEIGLGAIDSHVKLAAVELGEVLLKKGLLPTSQYSASKFQEFCSKNGLTQGCFSEL